MLFSDSTHVLRLVIGIWRIFLFEYIYIAIKNGSVIILTQLNNFGIKYYITKNRN